MHCMHGVIPPFVRPRSDTHVSVKFSSHFSYIHVCHITQTPYFYQILIFVHVVYNAGSMRNGYTFVGTANMKLIGHACISKSINIYSFPFLLSNISVT